MYRSDLCNTHSLYFLLHIWLSVHPPMGIWVAFTNMTNCVMNMVVQILLSPFFWIFLCILKWCVSCSFSNESFEKLCHYFHSGAVFYVPTKRIRGSYFVNTFQHLVFSGFIYYFAMLNLMSINWRFIVILIYISPMMDSIEMFFSEEMSIQMNGSFFNNSFPCCWVVVFTHST